MRYILTYITILLTSLSFGQKLTTSVSQDVIFIGEKIILTYSIELNKNDNVKFSPKENFITCFLSDTNSSVNNNSGEFEILSPFYDTTIHNRTNKIWRGTYAISAWKDGVYIIPEQSVVINDSIHYFKPASINVKMMEDDENIDIYDIRESQIELPESPITVVAFLKKYWWLIALAVLLVVAIIVIKNKRKINQEPIKELSLKEATLIAIESLEKQKLWEKDKLKEHFIELSLILRLYLSKRYNVTLLDKTTYEARLLLNQTEINPEIIQSITKILSESDMVKFAKSKPELVEILSVSTLAKQIVAETSPIQFTNV